METRKFKHVDSDNIIEVLDTPFGEIQADAILNMRDADENKLYKEVTEKKKAK